MIRAVSERTVDLAGEPTRVGADDKHRAFWDLVDDGRWEPCTFEAIDQLAEGGVYIDVGAWIGPTVLAAARRARTVIAYEPDPVAVTDLRHNVECNGLTNVEIREIALFDRDTELAIGPGMLDELGLSVSSLVYGSRSVTVTARDARQEATSDVFRQCSLLKIDVEGAEYGLIRRLAPYLRKHRPALLLSVHGVQWRTRTFRRLSPRMADRYRKLRSVIERSSLMWRLRSYPYVYIGAGPSWRQLSGPDRRAIVADIDEHELLLTVRPYPPG
jgi:FkbM family methyltransferase